jgi:hypothetical protein
LKSQFLKTAISKAAAKIVMRQFTSLRMGDLEIGPDSPKTLVGALTQSKSGVDQLNDLEQGKD